MGPITGIRILNLRVRDKVAYPDVTIDLVGRRAGHLVVGLENGGGKSTLLGAVYHVFVPDADDFLPRRAQKRQGKHGEPKRLEDYVPGGDPTHFIVELDAPIPPGTLPLAGSPRILIGACLWKPSGAPAGTRASETFWSARGVSPLLALRQLTVRGTNGRLLDHVEFVARMKQLRTELPAAQIVIEDGKAAWQKHLRDLGIDVDYVRQFLLRMNEDEGAADRVFTYASSREFLNSLVGVVGDPTAIAQLKTRLAETEDDAASVLLDRKRVALLETLAEQTEQLATTMSALEPQRAVRDLTVRRLTATRQKAGTQLESAKAAARELGERKDAIERAVAEARTSYGETHARYVRAKLQVAEIDVKNATTTIDRTEAERTVARTQERVGIAAAFLADRRTAESRIKDLDDLLTKRAREAEPLRMSLASAVSALDQRLTADRKRLDEDLTNASEAHSRAESEHDAAVADASQAEAAVASLTTERTLISAEADGILAQLGSAVSAKLLNAIDQDASIAARRAHERSQAELTKAHALEQVRTSEVQTLQIKQARHGDLAGEIARAESVAQTARAEFERALGVTRALEASLLDSGFLDTNSVALATHADAISQRLAAVLEAARLRQVSAAVGAAATKRATSWLTEHERLPPRADVERLCERAQKRRLGAHAGWSYLATLPQETALSYASSQPGLADGIVVPIPEDFAAVVELIKNAQEELEGPVIVGPPQGFELPTLTDPSITVVLPSPAFWSQTAARELEALRADELSRWEAEYAGATQRSDAALRLRERGLAWISDVGTTGLDTRAREAERLATTVATVVAERKALGDEIAAHITARDEAERGRDAARDEAMRAQREAERLESLHVLQRRRAEITKRHEEIDNAMRAATEQEVEARERATGASHRRSAAMTRIGEIKHERGSLSSQKQELAGLAVMVVKPGDVVSESDVAADRLLLAEHVRDREARWRGAVTDPQLRTQVDGLRAELRGLDKRLEEYRDVEAPARTLLRDDPSRSADDYRADAEQARLRVEQIGERIGELKAHAKQLETVANGVREEIRGLRRAAELPADERTQDADAAVAIRERLLRRRDEAMQLRVEREGLLESVTDEAQRASSRVTSLEPIQQRLTATLRSLGRGTSFLPAITVLDALPDEEALALLSDPALPAPLATIGRAYDMTQVFDSEDPVKGALGVVDNHAEALNAAIATLENQANTTLDQMEALLRGASEEVVKNDRMVQMFRAAARPTMAELAVSHHSDVEQRLHATRHHVSTFDARLDALAETVYATVAALLREVRQTVRDSQLPNTPAMGRWAGLELLKLSGLDTLKVDQKKAAIAATLRQWFNIDVTGAQKRRFDSDDVVHELLAAVSPQFAAKILVPSDPLDPEHMPVDLLARETSGGEGVAVALIMASLLASRRASMRGHRRTTLMLDNPFAKVTKPEFLRLARDVATELNVQLVLFTGIRDVAALAVFAQLTQLRVSRRQNSNFVVPYAIDDGRLQTLLRDGTLYASPVERVAAETDTVGTWPLMSLVTVSNVVGTDD